MAIFNSYVTHYQRVNLHFPMVFLMVFLGFLWFLGIPFGDQTWHAEKSPHEMDVYSWGNH